MLIQLVKKWDTFVFSFLDYHFDAWEFRTLQVSITAEDAVKEIKALCTGIVNQFVFQFLSIVSGVLERLLN